MDELQANYLASLAEKIAALTLLSRDWRPGDQTTLQQIRVLTHSLHGSGATFGYPEISEAARKAEHAPESELLAALSHLLGVLKSITSNAKPKGDAASILIIDDDTDLAATLQHGFQRKNADYRVEVATTAVKAQEFLVKDRFDLILLDLVLPDRDGRDVLREIKYEFNLSTPVYVLSAIEKDIVRVECMALGADKFITKPVEADDLATTIDKFLKKNVKRELTLVPLGAELQHAASKPAAPPGGNRVTVSGLTIVVAEDDAQQANLIRQRLVKENLTVELAADGEAAIVAIKRHLPALCILDANMPRLDGFEVLRRVRADAKTAETPIIMLTAMGSEGDIIRAYDLGADDYILKPFSAIQLVARVKSLLKKSGAWKADK